MNAQIMLVFDIGDCGEGRLYAGIMDGTPDRFAGELCFHKGINFQEAAELFGGELVYPQDLEGKGFEIGQELALRAAIHYEVTSGSFGVQAAFTKRWDGRWGCGAFCMMQIRGSVEYTGKPDGQYRFSLSGEFSLEKSKSESMDGSKDGFKGEPENKAVLHGKAAMFLAAKPAAPDKDTYDMEVDNETPATVLFLECGYMEPGNFISTVTGTDSYEELPIPIEYADKKPKKFMKLKAELNLTDGTFMMQGCYRFQESVELDAMFYLSTKDENDKWWMVLQLHLRSLSEISDELENAGQFLGLGEIDAEVILSNTTQKITISDQQMLLPLDSGSQTDGQGMVPAGNVHELEIRHGLTFRVRLDLRDSLLKEAVDMQGDCIVSGFIPSKKGEAIILSGFVQKIVFLQFLDLNDLHISLTKERGNKVFAFRAAGELKFSFQELTLPAIQAEISLEKDETQKKVELCGRVGRIEKPLGIPYTVLEEISFHAISKVTFNHNTESVERKKEKAVYFKGKASIAGVSLGAWVLFAEHNPAVIKIEIGVGQKLSISRFVSQYCGCGWNDYLDISFYNGAICYCAGKRDVCIEGTYYKHGFHAQVNTKIFFFPEMSLSICVDDNGLTAAAQLCEKFSLAFLAFYLKKKDEMGQTVTIGPEVSISVSKKQGRQFAIKTRVEIFTVDMGEITVTMKKNIFRGTLSFYPKVPIWGAIGFTIDKKGFRLDKCTIPDFKLDKFKIPSMNLGSGGNGCHVKILESPKIKTKSKIDLKRFSWTKSGVTATFNLIVILKSESIFSTEKEGDEVVTLPFRELPLEIKKEDCETVSFEKLTEVLLRNIATITGKMFEQVITLQCFDNVLTEKGIKNLIRFLTIEGITWGVNELVSYLICQALKEAVAKGLANALTSLAAVPLVLLEGPTMILGGFLGTMDADGNYTAGKRAPEENKDEPEKNPEQPKAPSLSFEEDKLYIQWCACGNAQGYYPMIFDAEDVGKNERISSNVRADKYEETDAGEYRTAVMGMSKPEEDDCYMLQNLYRVYYGREYHVSLYAWNPEGAATGPAASIYLPNPPANMKVRYLCVEKKLYITWKEVERIDEYVIAVKWEEQGKSGQQTETRGNKETEAVIEQEPGRLVSVSVRGTAENVVGPSAVWDDVWLYDLKAPANVWGYRGNEGIVVKWDQVLYADRYRVIWSNGKEAQMDEQVIWGTEFDIPADKLKEDVSYQIQVQPMTDTLEGAVSPKISVLWNFLATPKILELVCREDGLMEVVLEANRMRYRQLVYPDGRAVALDEWQIPCEWETGEQAKVRLVECERQGQWSKPISLQPLPMPREVNAFVQDGSLCVNWTSAGEGCKYGMEIVAGEKVHIVEPLDGTEYRMLLSSFAGSAMLRVCLYTVDGEDTRRRSAAVEMTVGI